MIISGCFHEYTKEGNFIERGPKMRKADREKLLAKIRDTVDSLLNNTKLFEAVVFDSEFKVELDKKSTKLMSVQSQAQRTLITYLEMIAEDPHKPSRRQMAKEVYSLLADICEERELRKNLFVLFSPSSDPISLTSLISDYFQFHAIVPE